MNYIGNITQKNALPLEHGNSKIFLLDINNYTWIDTFEPKNTIPPSDPHSNPPLNNSTQTTSTSQSTTNSGIAVGAIVGAIVGASSILALMVIGFFGYKCYQRRQKNNGILEIAGNR